MSIQLGTSDSSTTTTATPTATATDDVEVVTATTIINTTVTVAANPTLTTSTDNDDIETATSTVTATLTVDPASTTSTSLPPINVAQIFPSCGNVTGTLVNMTIPDMVLPSNLTLSQVLEFLGNTTDCSELSQLLGVSNSTNSTSILRRRDQYNAQRKLYKYAIEVGQKISY